MRETAEFGGDERNVAEARQFVARVLTGWQVPTADAVLMLSELATNAIIHASSSFTVVVSCSPAGVVRVEVRDADPTPPIPELEIGSEALGGRGLLLVTALARQWGYHATDHGKTVWFEL